MPRPLVRRKAQTRHLQEFVVNSQKASRERLWELRRHVVCWHRPKNTQRTAPRGPPEEPLQNPLGRLSEEPLQNPLGRLSEEALQDMGFSNLSDMDVSEAMIDYLLSWRTLHNLACLNPIIMKTYLIYVFGFHWAFYLHSNYLEIFLNKSYSSPGV